MEQVEGCYGCRMLARRAADAQATIAALQARVQELEEWKRIVTGAGTDQESVIRLAAYEYTKIAVQCWKEANAKLESQLTQRTAERDTARRRVDELEAREVDVVMLREDLEHRTAELEAAKGKLDIILRVSRGEPNDELAVDYGGLGWENDPAVLGVYNLQAELERVRGELAETKEVEAALSSKVAEYEVELNGDPQNFYGRGRTVGLRTLIAALPKVEGEIEVSSGVYNFILLKHDSGTRFLCGQIETEHTARAIAALWQHRQGMEGSHE